MAEDIGVDPRAIRVMRARNNIPARYWPRVIEAAEKRGLPITIDELLAKFDGDGNEVDDGRQQHVEANG